MMRLKNTMNDSFEQSDSMMSIYRHNDNQEKTQYMSGKYKNKNLQTKNL